MNDEKRKGMKPIPPNLSKYLNEDQMYELRTIENFGWSIKFIRRPMFQEPIVVVVGPDGKSIGILEKDGRLNLEPNIEIRD